MFVTVKVAELLVPTRTIPKFVLAGVTTSRESPEAAKLTSA